MGKSQGEKIIKIKTPFEVEDLRTKLAIKRAYNGFKKTYSDEYPEIKANNSNRFWNAKFKTLTKFKELDGMTKDKINTIVKFLPNETSRILDLGIGQGYLEQRLKEVEKNYEFYGIDISEKAIIRLKKKFKGKFTLLGKVVLLFSQRKDSASRTKTLGDCPRAKRSQKPFLNCGGQGCCIISAQRRIKCSTCFSFCRFSCA